LYPPSAEVLKTIMQSFPKDYHAGSGEPAQRHPRGAVTCQAATRAEATGKQLIVPNQAMSCCNATGSHSVVQRQATVCLHTTGTSLLNLGTPSRNGKTGISSSLPVGSNGPSFLCDICGRSFTSKRGLASHLTHCRRSASQSATDVFPCDLCDRDFTTVHGLKIHRVSCSKKYTASHPIRSPPSTFYSSLQPNITSMYLYPAHQSPPETRSPPPLDKDQIIVCGIPNTEGNKTSSSFFISPTDEMQA